MTHPTWLLKPIEEYTEFPIDQVAGNLSRIYRYGGAIRWSVAAHSLMVADMVPDEFRLHALLHDAHEAWTGDLCLPAKEILEYFDEMEWHFDERIFEMLGIDPSRYSYQVVRKADKAAVVEEFKLTAADSNLLEDSVYAEHWARNVRVELAKMKVDSLQQ